MQSAAQAYNSVAKKTSSPRELEAMLLLRAAAKLQSLVDNWENTEREKIEYALLYNRKLWTIFVTSVTGPDNPLPPEIRQNIANLGLFVLSQTLAFTAAPRPEALKPLININCELAAGLSARAAAAA